MNVLTINGFRDMLNEIKTKKITELKPEIYYDLMGLMIYAADNIIDEGEFAKFVSDVKWI